MSTSLDTPYEQDTLFTLSPGGSYRIASTNDISLSSSVSLPLGYPLLSISDDITHRSIAQVSYQMQAAAFDICQQSASTPCQTRPTTPMIRLDLPTGSDLSPTKTNDTLSLTQGRITLMSVGRDGALLLSP